MPIWRCRAFLLYGSVDRIIKLINPNVYGVDNSRNSTTTMSDHDPLSIDSGSIPRLDIIQRGESIPWLIVWQVKKTCYLCNVALLCLFARPPLLQLHSVQLHPHPIPAPLAMNLHKQFDNPGCIETNCEFLIKATTRQFKYTLPSPYWDWTCRRRCTLYMDVIITSTRSTLQLNIPETQPIQLSHSCCNGPGTLWPH